MIDAVTSLNRDLAERSPWELAADSTRTDELHAVLGRQLASARAIATAAEPVVPELAERLHHQLGDGQARLPAPAPAFRRLDQVGESTASGR